MRVSRAAIAAAGLSLAVIGASLWISQNVFETIPHVEDEFANLWQAKVMASGRIALPSPPEAESFLIPFVVDYHGWRFGKYPPGWPAALAIGAWFGFPYWVNPLLAGVTVWLTFRLASRLAGRLAGVLAALLTASSPMLLMLSGSLMPHMLSIVLTLVWMLAWFDLFIPSRPAAATRLPRALLLAAGGLSMGLLVLTRPMTALAIALPFAVHAAILVVRKPRAVLRDLAFVFLLACGVAALLPVWQWALTGDLWLDLYTLWWPYDRIGFGPGVGVLEGGHTLRQAWINTQLSLFAWQHDLFGWPYLSWAFLPFGIWALRRRAEAWLSLAVLPALVLVYLAYWVGSWLLGPRYYVEALPALAAISAAGIVWAGGWMPGHVRRGRARRVAAVAAVLFLLSANAAVYLPLRVGGLHGLFGISRAALSTFDRVNPGAAVVIVERNPYWHGYGNLLTRTEPFSRSDLILVYQRDPEADRRAAAHFPALPVYRYDPTRPGVLVGVGPPE